MCYYNGIKVTRVEYIQLKELEKLFAKYEFLDQPLQIGFDYKPIPVLRKLEDIEDFEVVQMEWGFLPDSWYNIKIDTRAKAERFRKGFPNLQGQMMPGITTLNATAEELLLSSKIYRESALGRRCLVLSSGFYEWRHITPIGKKGQPLKTTVKYPYHVSLKEKEYFYIAAIWKPWKDVETGEYSETVAVITTAANSLMEQVHNSKKRMPTILDEDLAYEWVFGKLDEKRIKEIASTQYPATEMQACTITKSFRESLNPAEPFQFEDLPALELNF